MPLTALTGSLGVKRAAHLLRRATFGATKQQIDYFANLTASQAVTQLFATDLPDPILPIDPATGQEWVESGVVEGANSGDDELRAYFKAWFIGQMMSTDIADSHELAYALREKITLFLHTHFTTMEEKVDDSRALYFQNALFRLFAFDKEDENVVIVDEDTGSSQNEIAPRNFKELTKKICIDNAMLIFLDGRQNVKGSVNENYAREMFELYTIGRGLEARVNGMTPPGPDDYFTFTEQDVQSAAKVLSGFDRDENFETIDQYTGIPRGRIKGGVIATQHAEGVKQFSDYFSGFNDGKVTPDPTLFQGGPTEESAIDEISQLIDMIYSREETARHICRRLYRFFVYYDIDETLDDDVIAQMTATFTANDFKIQPVLEELFQSEHFYDNVSGVEDDKFGGIIKSPLDLILGTLKFLEIKLPSYQANLESFYMMTASLTDLMGRQGMTFYEPYEVAGYVAYHQYPVYNRNWISTNYLTQRYDYIRQLMNQNEGLPAFDILEFVKLNFNAQATDAKQFITTLAPYIFPFAENLDYEVDGGDLTKERIRYFLQVFIQFDDYQNTAAVNQANADWGSLYADPSKYLEAGEYLRRLFNAMMQSPEYQLF
ncbi:DUF1800 domain-containing protein [Fulvivirga ulvae]|uniref:DUF1800 domain-containing protein n=1 Tax=Fulvivirga ulvae TaxID=2904245 RepID=UPI001F28ACB1|nr:DUF1800 family protein [Fulvivirga ulvae]UII30822.1 DUF1800 domain-containing protein [Fulvivirga ulvae]